MADNGNNGRASDCTRLDAPQRGPDSGKPNGILAAQCPETEFQLNLLYLCIGHGTNDNHSGMTHNLHSKSRGANNVKVEASDADPVEPANAGGHSQERPADTIAADSGNNPQGESIPFHSAIKTTKARHGIEISDGRNAVTQNHLYI